MDEVGNNTSQDDDGNKGGTKYVAGNGWRPQQTNANDDCHYTTLGFCAANGEAVMAAVIIKGEALKKT